MKPSVPKCWLEGEDQVGEVASLRCRLEEGSSPLTYSWRRSTGKLPITAVQSKWDFHSRRRATTNQRDRPPRHAGVCLLLREGVNKGFCWYSVEAYCPHTGKTKTNTAKALHYKPLSLRSGDDWFELRLIKRFSLTWSLCIFHLGLQWNCFSWLKISKTKFIEVLKMNLQLYYWLFVGHGQKKRKVVSQTPDSGYCFLPDREKQGKQNYNRMFFAVSGGLNIIFGKH